MPTLLTMVSADGKPAGEIELPEGLFAAKINVPLMHQVVVAQQAAARQGTHSTKTRGEVRGGGRKPFKQKGTGRARQGSTRAPQFNGGGVVHGPTPRDYSQRTPRKMKAGALRAALTDRVQSGRLHVVKSFDLGDRPSTKEALGVLQSVIPDADNKKTKYLCVLEREGAVEWLSLRNVQAVHAIAVDQLNTYDVLLSDHVVFTESSYQAFVAAKLRDVSGSRRAGAPNRDADLLETMHGFEKRHHDGDLNEAHKAATAMKNVTSHRSEDPDIDGWSVSSDTVEFVALERHRDHVTVSWPTTMSSDAFVEFVREQLGDAVAVFASGDGYYESVDGQPVDWGAVNKIRNVGFFRADAGTRSLMWESPSNAETRDGRVILVDRHVEVPPLYDLMRATGVKDAAMLVRRFVPEQVQDLEALAGAR